MEIKGFTIGKIPVVELIQFSEKQIRAEYLENVKSLIGDNTKALIDASLRVPRGEELSRQAEEWRGSFDGIVSTLQFALKYFNKDIKPAQIKDVIESMDGEQIVAVIHSVYGLDDVDDKKK